MSLSGLLQLAGTPPVSVSAPDPSTGQIPQGNPDPTYSGLQSLTGGGGAPVIKLNPVPPAGVGAASTNGSVAQSAIQSAATPQTTSTPVTAVTPINTAQKPIPPELQSVIDSLKSGAQESRERYNNVQDQIKQAWDNVQGLQNKIVSSKVPQQQNLTMNPAAALLALAGAGATQNRFNQAGDNQFVPNLLGGLQHNLQTGYENQMAQHNQTMQVLANAVQSAKDQGNNLRFLLPTLAKQPEQDNAAIASNITKYFNNQQTNQTRGDIANNRVAGQQAIYDVRSADKAVDQGLKNLQAAPPEARPALVAALQQLRPSIFGNLSEGQILDYANPTPKESQQLAAAHVNQIRAENLGGLLQSQIGDNNAKAKLALAQVDRIPHQMDLDDAHTQSLYKIVSNYDADHAAQRAKLYGDEYNNRMKVNLAAQDSDAKSWHQGINEGIQIQGRLLNGAKDQLNALNKQIAAQGGTPTDEQNLAINHLGLEIQHATSAMQHLQPLASGQAPIPTTDKFLNQMYGGYSDPTGQTTQASIDARQYQPPPSNVKQPGITAIVPKGELQPLGVKVDGGIGPGKAAKVTANPLSYLGQMKQTDVIPGAGNLPLSQVLASANAAIQRDPTKRAQVIQRLKGWGVTAQ